MQVHSPLHLGGSNDSYLFVHFLFGVPYKFVESLKPRENTGGVFEATSTCHMADSDTLDDWQSRLLKQVNMSHGFWKCLWTNRG